MSKVKLNFHLMPVQLWSVVSDILADTVKVTFRTKGRNCVGKSFGSPLITNDGVTIASKLLKTILKI